MKKKLFDLLWNILSSGLPKDYNIEILRKIVLINFFYSFACFFLFSFSIITLIEKEYLFFVVDSCAGIILIALMLWLRNIKEPKYPIAVGITIAISLFFFLFAAGGPNNNKFLWSLTLPLIVIFLVGNKKGIAIALLFILFIIMLIMSTYLIYNEPLQSFSTTLRYVSVYLIIMLYAIMMEKARDLVQTKLIDTNEHLEKSLREIKTLSGLLPICYKCKKVRDDKGYWSKIENYIQQNSDAQFSHTLCTECSEEEFGNEEWFIKYKKKKEENGEVE